jgi:hypothetical protein
VTPCFGCCRWAKALHEPAYASSCGGTLQGDHLTPSAADERRAKLYGRGERSAELGELVQIKTE